LNVCIYRIPVGESIVHPRSHCPKCRTMIAWYDNLPLVSWFALRARCRHCDAAIPSRYVGVEFLTALLFLGIWLREGFTLVTPAYWLLASLLVAASFIDLDYMIIPDRFSLGGLAAGLILSAGIPALHLPYRVFLPRDYGVSFLWGALGAAAGFSLLWLVSVVGRALFKKDAMGFGDVKLLGAIGAFLGVKAVLFTIVVSSLAGTVIGLLWMWRRGKQWQSRIPYGPFLAAGALVWMLAGPELWRVYTQWLAPAM
jgi:leader peptidase (prepilin peptidase) / N-methyltransferase